LKLLLEYRHNVTLYTYQLIHLMDEFSFYIHVNLNFSLSILCWIYPLPEGTYIQKIFQELYLLYLQVSIESHLITITVICVKYKFETYWNPLLFQPLNKQSVHFALNIKKYHLFLKASLCYFILASVGFHEFQFYFFRLPLLVFIMIHTLTYMKSWQHYSVCPLKVYTDAP
jgi:hypothetical protein